MSDTSSGTPRWVRILALVVVAAVVALLVVQLVTGGDHGPGRHGP